MSVPAAGVATVLRPAGEPAGGGCGAHRRIVVAERAADPGAGVLVAEPASLSGGARSSGSLSEQLIA